MAHLKGSDRKKYVANMFARIADRYDLMNTIMTFGMHHHWRGRAASLASHELKGHVLDVASGTGDLAIELVRKSPNVRVVALDLTPKMLRLAFDKTVHKGLSNKIQQTVGDALHLPFADNLFSSVTIGFGIRNIPDVTKAIREMTRVIIPGGKIVILEIVQSRGILSPATNFYFNTIIPLLGKIVAKDSEAYNYLRDSVEFFPTADGLTHLMEETGLANITCQTFGLGTVAIHVGTKHKA